MPDSMRAASHRPDLSAPYNRLVTVDLFRLCGIIISRHGLGNTALKHRVAVFDVTASFHYTRLFKRKYPLVIIPAVDRGDFNHINIMYIYK